MKEVIDLDSLQIGKYLSALRKYYKITQDELANRLNVTRQAISKWETGVTIPDIELLMKLSEIVRFLNRLHFILLLECLIPAARMMTGLLKLCGLAELFIQEQQGIL